MRPGMWRAADINYDWARNMIRLKRRNTAWLIALGALIAVALVAANIAVDLQITLLGIFMLALAGSFIGFDLTRGRELLDNVQRTAVPAETRTRPRVRTSPQAKEAVERAERRGGYIESGLELLDVGLITLQTGRDDIVMRRTRSISKDDDGVRPFVVLNVEPEEAERKALIRFEIYDHTGKQQYVYEMKTYLREGEMNLLADHHLPLRGNEDVSGMGDWDLRVYIDGNLAGLHNFMLAPSLSERRRRLSPNADIDDHSVRIRREEDAPLSLQELLQSSSSRRSAANPPPARRPRTARPRDKQ